MKKLYWALCLCVMLLAGCGGQKEIEVPSYTVTFTMCGHICSEQTVPDGHLPESVLTHVPGLRFVQWCDEEGEPVNPYTTFVHRDTRYEAEAYPELTNHVPYLFMDEEGYLRPDDALTADALAAALDALATQDAKNYFPGMPAGEHAITVGTLIGVLDHFFPVQTVEAAFEGAEDETVSRTRFAQGMQLLLGRQASETISMDSSVPLPNDITRDREDAIVLMEASMPHTPFTGEHLWTQVVLPVRYEPGFVNTDGWLYYVQQDYLILKDGYVGSFYFGSDGRYTSGNAELDEQVAAILGQLIAENPGASRQALLRLAFDHCCGYDSQRKTVYDFGQTGWETEEALLMFLEEKGDCYNYAAAFWALARGLGFEARAVSGTRGTEETPHGWVMICIDGQDYFFDPERQRSYRDSDMFMIPMEKNTLWNYRWEES